jgi:UDP-N-acetylmuramoylalanine--D-glutamate ligase
LVLGLARSGEAAALVLRDRGERVIGVDAGRDDPALQAGAERLCQAGVEVHLDVSDAADHLLAQAGALVKSPGVPPGAPAVVAARQAGIPVLGELELAWRLLANDFIAVTGTNGKTTTTEWIGHIHREAGLPVAVAGNVGTALSSLVGSVSAEATIVCECSSFQLEDAVQFAPEAGVLLNIAPDHLDRHASFEEYTAAKMKVFNDNEVSVIPPDGLWVSVPGRVVRYGTGPEAALADEIRLPGEHNRKNGLAAAAVCLARGVDEAATARGLRSFPGVAHRLERVATIDGVGWVNDSKATNVASTVVALEAFPGGVHLIAGGRGKGQDFSPLAPLVTERCHAVYLIGEDAGQIADALAPTQIPLHGSRDMERAVAAAYAAASPGEVVLLSPACASYDQYRDFEARGEDFRALVRRLSGERGSE